MSVCRCLLVALCALVFVLSTRVTGDDDLGEDGTTPSQAVATTGAPIQHDQPTEAPGMKVTESGTPGSIGGPTTPSPTQAPEAGNPNQNATNDVTSTIAPELETSGTKAPEPEEVPTKPLEDDKKVEPPKNKNGASPGVTGVAWLLTLIVATALSFLD